MTNTRERAGTDEETWLLVGKIDERRKAWLCWGLDEWSLDDLVLYANQRWTTEHFHREVKQFLGINEFEGQTWDGWHRHIITVLLAHAFLLELIEIASDYVSLGTVSADAEFDDIGVIDALEEKSLSYLIRKSSDDHVD